MLRSRPYEDQDGYVSQLHFSFAFICYTYCSIDFISVIVCKLLLFAYGLPQIFRSDDEPIEERVEATTKNDISLLRYMLWTR